MDKIISPLRPSIIERVAGSGNKFIHLAEERSDYYLNFVPGFKFWDMCASEALITSRLGIVTDAQKRPLEYERNINSYTVKSGIIAAQNKLIYKMNMERIEESIGITLSEA